MWNQLVKVISMCIFSRIIYTSIFDLFTTMAMTCLSNCCFFTERILSQGTIFYLMTNQMLLVGYNNWMVLIGNMNGWRVGTDTGWLRPWNFLFFLHLAYNIKWNVNRFFSKVFYVCMEPNHFDKWQTQGKKIANPSKKATRRQLFETNRLPLVAYNKRRLAII